MRLQMFLQGLLQDYLLRLCVLHIPKIFTLWLPINYFTIYSSFLLQHVVNFVIMDLWVLHKLDDVFHKKFANLWDCVWNDTRFKLLFLDSALEMNHVNIGYCGERGYVYKNTQTMNSVKFSTKTESF